MKEKDPSDVFENFVSEYFGYSADSSKYIGCLSTVRTPIPDVKIVATYLPQFYPIEENDKWWGNGFTEWRSVTKAVPQFVGHYQPRLPTTELGFYDLRVRKVQEQQAALAKQAGISAFCFYFYWFNGKTLLETPIRNFAENKNIDFEFCLCWANDDWSRAWSGDSEILIQQSYHAGDDIAFISHLSQYLKNEKYLRIDGKPLIMVWRPTLLPDVRGTVQRWRDWCMQNGVGPIHICCSQAYERLDPADHGMDSAYQNPPSDTRWIEPNIDRFAGPVDLLNKEFVGQLFDYRSLVRHAREFVPPDYLLFRGACPSWDNEARRPGRGRVLVGADPQAYLEFLETVLDQTQRDVSDPGKRMVFINAWNEWGEGAHLEPDRLYGFGNLEATRMAALRSALRHSQVHEPERLAVVVHAYYIDLLDECLGWLNELTIPHDVFITTSEDRRPMVEAFIARQEFSATVVSAENRGRDIAPFLRVLQSLDFRKYGTVLKLHTKVSPAGRDGSLWRKGLFHALADEASLKKALALFGSHPEIGITGPSEFLLSMRPFLGRNEHAVRRLAERMGVFAADPDAYAFFAGTMFLARTKALLPLGALGLLLKDFEPEQGQSNGTLAHAIERAITYSAKAAGFEVAAFDVTNHSVIFEGRPDFPYVVPLRQ